MKKIIFTAIALLMIIPTTIASAQMMYGRGQYPTTAYPVMMGYYATSTIASSSASMDAEELSGQALLQQLESKNINCLNLTQSDYGSIGEYYMSLMMGSGHDAMDSYIVNRYGQTYDDQMHLVMGERFSGCNADFGFPVGMMGFGPMMGAYGYQSGFGYNWSEAIFMVILWFFAVIGLFTALRWGIKLTKK